jgi:dTDP-L-rhamnose 4-epimerase
LLALESDAAVGRAVNLGTGRPSTVADVARVMSDGLGLDIDADRSGLYRAGDIRHCYADPSRALELLGFEAQVRLEQGMRELIEWLAAQEAEDRVDDAARELDARGLTV